MKISDAFRRFLNGIYPAQRVEKVEQQCEDARESVGLETLVGQLSGDALEPAYRLVIDEPGNPIRVETLGIGEYLIGRAPDCNIAITLGCVSRVHCLLTVHNEGRVTLRDLNSLNGTIVNGLRLPADGKHVLHIYDRFILADVSVTLIRM